MPRLPRSSGSHGAPGRKIPWLTWLAIGRAVATRARRGWEHLTPAERDRLAAILRGARSGPTTVPPEERRELRRLVGKALWGAAR